MPIHDLSFTIELEYEEDSKGCPKVSTKDYNFSRNKFAIIIATIIIITIIIVVTKWDKPFTVRGL